MAVARIILSRAARGARCRVRARSRSTCATRYGLAVLACIVTATPGHGLGGLRLRASTMLLIHVLDLVDEEAWVRTIKGSYERLLMEIFE